MPEQLPEIRITKPKKIDENVLQVTRDVIGVTATYTYEFLVGQRAAILADLAQYQAMRQIELDEVDKLLAECQKLGIKSKPVPEPEPE